MSVDPRRFSCVVAVLLVLAATQAARAESTASRPNIVLVTIDTQRADSFGAYGNPGGHTPRIDEVARKSAVFDRATSPIGTTFSSHASLLTGLYPRAHGVRDNGEVLDESFRTLTEILRDAGYETMAFVSYGSMVRRGGLGQGFATTSHQDPELPEHDTDPDVLVTLATEELLRERSAPFFLWVQFFHPHAPYDVTSYAKEKLTGYDGPLKNGATVRQYYSLKNKELPAADREALRVLYDGETREADRAVGAILDALEEGGHANDTIVVITADHGQLLGEHLDVGHGFRLWEPVLHVPLIVYDPRAPESRRIPQRVGLIDVTPTLLDLLGADTPEGLDGRSFAPLLRGETLPERAYFGEVCRSRKKSQKKRDPNAIAVFLGDEKLIINGGKTLVFDLAADPDEAEPVTTDVRDPRAKDLVRAALGFRKRKQYRRPNPEEPLKPKVESELRALGYIE